MPILIDNTCKYCFKSQIVLNLVKVSYYYCAFCNFFSLISKNNLFFKKFNNNKKQYNYYQNIISEKYSLQKPWNIKKIIFLKKILKSFKKKINILDISGGPGLDALYVIKKYKKKINNYNISEYNKNFTKNFNNLKISQAKCFHIDYDKKIKIKDNIRYDLIMIFQSIYYCKNLNKIYSFVRSKLKKNGYLAIVSPVPTIGFLLRITILEKYLPSRIWSENLIKNFFISRKFSLVQNKHIISRHNILKKYFIRFSTFKSSLISLLAPIFFFLMYIKFNKLFNYKFFLEGADYLLLLKKK